MNSNSSKMTTVPTGTQKTISKEITCMCAKIAWFPVHSARCPKKGFKETKKVDFVQVSTPVVRLSPLSANADRSDYECLLDGDEEIDEMLNEAFTMDV